MVALGEAMDEVLPPISEDAKLRLIKRAISSDEGWQTLAKSVISAIENGTPDAKEKCVELLRKIAGDRKVSVAIDNSEEPYNQVNFADLLVQQLEYNLALVSVTKEEK
jgi:hypothetical protein